MRPLAFTDFPRSRVEEHYITSHPAKWIEYQHRLETKGRSAETNADFFDANKLTSHFRRVQNSSIKKTVSRDVGDLIKSLYEKDKSYATDVPAVRSVSILEMDSSDSEEDSINQGWRGYIADLGSEATFLHLVELVKAGLSYRQVSEVVAPARSKISGACSLFKPVTRQTASTYTRLIAAVGFDALSSIIKHAWAYSLAADASSLIHGVASFSIRIRVPLVDTKKSSLHNLHVVAPPLQGSHTGATMFSLTAEAMGALDPRWRTKLIGVTSDGAANMAGRFSGWQKLLQDACESPFYRVHCGPHRLSLINGRAIATLRKTRSGWLDKLYVTVKLL
jgi:hypothetical protein